MDNLNLKKMEDTETMTESGTEENTAKTAAAKKKPTTKKKKTTAKSKKTTKTTKTAKTKKKATSAGGADSEIEESTKLRPRTGRGGTHNFPNAKMEVTDENRPLVQQLLRETLVAYKQPKVKNDVELAERLQEYFAMCAERGQIPTVEEMCLYTGYGHHTCYKWEAGLSAGFSPETGSIIKKAKEYMKTFDAKLVVAGKQNPIVYFFRAKNYYGMSDKQEVVLTPNNQFSETVSDDELRRRYLEDSGVDYVVEGSAEDANG